MALTARQSDALAFIQRFAETHGYAPTVREVQGAIGHASVSSTHALLMGLRDQGLISWNPSTPRTLRVRV